MKAIEIANRETAKALRCTDYPKTRKVAILLLRMTLARLEDNRTILAMSETQAQSLLAFQGLPLDVPKAAKLLWQVSLVLATILTGGQRDTNN